MKRYDKLINKLPFINHAANKLRNQLIERDKWITAFHATLDTPLFPVVAALRSRGFPAPEYISADDTKCSPGIEFTRYHDGDYSYVFIPLSDTWDLVTYTNDWDEVACTYDNFDTLLSVLEDMRLELE